MEPRFFLPCFHSPRASRLGHNRKGKTRSITCRTDRANEANERYVSPIPYGRTSGDTHTCTQMEKEEERNDVKLDNIKYTSTF